MGKRVAGGVDARRMVFGSTTLTTHNFDVDQQTGSSCHHSHSSLGCWFSMSTGKRRSRGGYGKRGELRLDNTPGIDEQEREGNEGCTGSIRKVCFTCPETKLDPETFCKP
jgi:hypothetical protein